MMQEYESRQSQELQKRLEVLQREADMLFSLEPLRNLLWRELRKSLDAEKNYLTYCEHLRDDKLAQLAWDLLHRWGSTLDEIKVLFDNQFPGEDFMQCMLTEREELIDRFAHSKPASWWALVNQDDAQTVRTFANRLYRLPGEQVDGFFYMIDKLSILTDLINHRDTLYGMQLDYPLYARLAAERLKKAKEERHLTDQQLKTAIEACSEFFWGKVSWAVVYAVCVEEYGFKKNATLFEELVQSLHIRVGFDCTPGTISAARRDNEFLAHPISDWSTLQPHPRVLRLLENVRRTLRKACDSQKS